MKNKIQNKISTLKKILLLIIFSTILLNCNTMAQSTFKSKVVYNADDLIIKQISENSFIHISYLQTKDYGLVQGNGLIVRNNNETIVFDTPADDKSADELIKWLENTLHCKIVAVIATHFHQDCLGGLKAFHVKGIPSYAYFKTIELAKENNFVLPENSFKDSLILKVGNQEITAKFFGEGHTKDNVVGYFPSDNVMFGGCLVKEINAGKGFLGDSNVNDWSNTVAKVKNEYSDVKIVVPGHGEYGDNKLLDYTINLFNQ